MRTHTFFSVEDYRHENYIELQASSSRQNQEIRTRFSTKVTIEPNKRNKILVSTRNNTDGFVYINKAEDITLLGQIDNILIKRISDTEVELSISCNENYNLWNILAKRELGQI